MKLLAKSIFFLLAALGIIAAPVNAAVLYDEDGGTDLPSINSATQVTIITPEGFNAVGGTITFDNVAQDLDAFKLIVPAGLQVNMMRIDFTWPATSNPLQDSIGGVFYVLAGSTPIGEAYVAGVDWVRTAIDQDTSPAFMPIRDPLGSGAYLVSIEPNSRGDGGTIGYVVQFDVSSTLPAVPEPGSFALCAAGICMILVSKIRSKSKHI